MIADRNIETATVTANCRNSSPEMPGMNATGTNTDSNTSVIAMIGAVISAIARLIASPGESSGCSSMIRSTFSTTTIASSTTMPIASTIGEQRHGIGGVTDRIEDDEGADQTDRHREGRDQRRAQAAEKQINDQHHQTRTPRSASSAPHGSFR